VIESARPCEDCETGACPCGVTCEGCDYTGLCQSCFGTCQVGGSVRDPVKLGRPAAGQKSRRSTPPCLGCDRRKRYDSPYFGLSVDEVHAQLNADIKNREHVRCALCGRAFTSFGSEALTVAMMRGAAERWRWIDGEVQRIPYCT
jgi:hypothetical protein